MDNLERIRSVQYELFSQKFGNLIIQEPKGWSSDTESFKRDADSRSITSKIDVDLEFFGNASKYLRDVYNTLGIEERVVLTKYEKNKFSLSEEWAIKYVQELDLTTYKIISRTGNVSVNAREGGLFSDIKIRESDEYDLLDNLSADEIDLGSLKTQVFQPLGRKLFVESKLDGEAVGYRVNSYRYDRFGSVNNVSTVRTIPLNVVYNSNEKDVVSPFNSSSFQNDTIPHSESTTVGSTQNIGDLFFFRAEQEITLNVSLNMEYKVSDFRKGSNVEEFEFGVRFFRTKLVGVNDELTDDFEVDANFDPSTSIGTLKTISNYNKTITLETGDSLGFVFKSKFDYKGFFGDGRVDVYSNVLSSLLVLEDQTKYEEDITISRCIKPLEFFNRLIAKITGKNGLVKSSIFEKGGEYEFTVIDNGLFARGFPDSYPNGNDEEQRIQLKSSFKNAFESFNYLEPLCWYTEFIGNKEYIRIEKATYTQQNFIGIKLGNVDNIEYESSKMDYFSKIEIGHDKSLDYEEINGLDETNGKSEFSTFVTKNISAYSVISKFRTDSVGYELTRRLPFKLYPKEDSKRDSDIWIHDAYSLPSGVITHKKWDYEGRFTSKPIGIYDPNSAWNLWLSPMNRLYYGHSYSVKRGLYHYGNKRIRFNSSNANQNLITEKNGLVLSESGSIKISDIPKARVEATMINFNFNMNQSIENMFKGTTKIEGVNIKNYFGLIEYIERGVKKYGRLVTLESSDEAKITLIKARL